MNKEKINKSDEIFYENINATLSGDKLGENVLYFPSVDNNISASNKTNPFTSIIHENIQLYNTFMCYDVKSTFQISTDILSAAATYIANSIMMNSITIFENPWNKYSMINTLKIGFIKHDPDDSHFYSPLFYTCYNNFIKDCNDAVFGAVSQTLRNYFYNYTNGTTEVNADYIVSFINDMVLHVSKIYADNGQRFIADIITNGCLYNGLLNRHLLLLKEKMNDIPDEDFGKMTDDNGYAITFLNMALNNDIAKISEITEAISYSGVFYIRDAIRDIDWKKCSNNRKNSIVNYQDYPNE